MFFGFLSDCKYSPKSIEDQCISKDAHAVRRTVPYTYATQVTCRCLIYTIGLMEIGTQKSWRLMHGRHGNFIERPPGSED